MELIAPKLWQIESVSTLTFDELSDWFAFYFSRGTTAVLIRDGDCKGIAVMKLFSRLEQFFEDYVHEPSGKFVEVVAAYFGEKATMQACLNVFKERWGAQEIVMWERGSKKTGLAPRIYRWEQYERLVRKFSHELTKAS